jgi:gliding-associated putative ABC transporter substrate-binding component GldG
MAAERNKAKTGANAVVFMILVIVAVVAVNLIVRRFPKRFDLTQDHVYTLSGASKDLVAKLPDVLTVKAFISKDLQPPFSQSAQYVRDLLDEYAHASKGKLKWEAIDPGEDSKLEEEATKMKVPKMRRGRISNNKVEIGASYLGIALSYQGNVESIPEVNATEGLEFEIDKRVRMLTQKKTKIAFATSEGELSTGAGPQGQGGGLTALKQYMDFYDAVPTDLKGKQIPDDVVALVIAGPKQPMSERAKFVVDQFLMKGKSVAFFVDGMTFETPQQMQIPGQATPPQIGRKNDTGMDDLLAHYGFKIGDDVILEPQKNVPGPLQIDGQWQMGNYPTFLVTDSIAKSSPLFEHVDALIVPFASSVELLKDNKAQAGLVYTQLAQSSGQSWRQKGFFLLNPTVALKPSDDKGPFALGYTAEGKFKSFFAGKPFPNEKGEKVSAPPANASLPPDAERPIDEAQAPGRIIVMGSANMVSDMYIAGVSRYVPVYQIDLAFALNVMDWLAQDKALSSIRAKSITQRPITYGSESTPTVLEAINIIGVPLAFILFGVARWRIRSARRARAKI